MKTIYKAAIGVLACAVFLTGYAVRIVADEREKAREIALQERGIFVNQPGVRVASVNLDGTTEVDFKPLQTLLSVLTNLRQYYVERLTEADEHRMTVEAVRSMLASLQDPNTRYLEPADRRILAESQEGVFHGIGAVLGVKRVHTGEFVEGPPESSEEKILPGVPPKPRAKREIVEEHLVVVSVLPGSPAEAAGLQTGDDIIAVNSKPVLPLDPYQKIDKILKEARSAPLAERSKFRKLLEAEQKRIENGIGILEAQNLLARGDGEQIELTLAAAEGGDPRELKIKTRKLVVEPVTTELVSGGTVARLKINYLGSGTGEAFDRAMEKVQSPEVRGLVLDLRGVAGGQIEAARRIAAWFVPGKPLAVELRSRGRKTTVETPDPVHGVWKKPLVVLVDRGTARAAEILAAALRENGAAKLVGQKTWGDMTVTSLIDQPDGSAIILTTGALLTSKGGAYAGKGIPVDVEMAAGASGEEAVKEALKLLSAGHREVRVR